MTASEPQPESERPQPDRADLIDALSWAEDFERGRWGTQYATAVLDAHDARVHAVLLAEMQRLRDEVIDLKGKITDRRRYEFTGDDH